MTTRPNRHRRRGFALMLVMLEVVLITALWGIAHRQLATTMRFLDYMNQQGQAQQNSSQNVDGYKPLARALSLLETGDPPGGDQGVYTCNTTILTPSGPAYFTITYLKGTGDPDISGSSNETWTVTSTQQFPDPQGLATWDNMPSTFGN